MIRSKGKNCVTFLVAIDGSGGTKAGSANDSEKSSATHICKVEVDLVCFKKLSERPKIFVVLEGRLCWFVVRDYGDILSYFMPQVILRDQSNFSRDLKLNSQNTRAFQPA